jgi:hypothetical protein
MKSIKKEAVQERASLQGQMHSRINDSGVDGGK